MERKEKGINASKSKILGICIEGNKNLPSSFHRQPVIKTTIHQSGASILMRKFFV